ncbi:Serine/threonine-protein kinase/endoribonuclease IRE1 [Collichthys lucidus]|uniref:Serine/threonine-protein kinase/endoribonuclease IRE1 n=1 Tax=Collichthys lucidus TaxID=240159 RepID=A0A4U5TUA7_COLLU|nr:Serine/threonine-protein kinase/endoribonuclease IRE1 [Collichthys lucidus]
MLIYYIYTGGHQPFGDVPCDNIDVDDVLAKDLMEMMIDAEPQNRPKVEECLNHPLFWSTERLHTGPESNNSKDTSNNLSAEAPLTTSKNLHLLQ